MWMTLLRTHQLPTQIQSNMTDTRPFLIKSKDTAMNYRGRAHVHPCSKTNKTRGIVA